MEKFKIEKNIPMPDSASSKYPFSKMEIKDSFLVGKLDAKNTIIFRTTANNCGKKLKMKFSTKKIEGGAVRCWRVK